MLTMYGIPNCDTIKKAKRYLTQSGVEYQFHDYKKQGVDAAVLAQAISALNINTVVNTRGTTFRKLSEDEKAVLVGSGENIAKVIAVLNAHPSVIKRPILRQQLPNTEPTYMAGFSESTYQDFLNDA